MLPSRQILPSLLALDFGLVQAHVTPRATTSTHTPQEWERYPNATGSWPIYGIDISKPLTAIPDANAYGKGNRWSIDVAVAYNWTDGPSSQSKNRYAVTIKAPDRPFEVLDAYNSSAGYEMCAQVGSRRHGEEQRKKLEEDGDGSCNGVIPNDCVQDLKHSLRDGSCTKDVGLPESCEAALNNMNAGIVRSDPISSIADALNETSPSFKLAGASTNPTAESEHGESEQTYDETVAQVFAVLLGWEYGDGENKSEHSVFRCVRANNVVEDGRDTGAPGTSCKHTVSLGLVALGCTLALGVH